MNKSNNESSIKNEKNYDHMYRKPNSPVKTTSNNLPGSPGQTSKLMKGAVNCNEGIYLLINIYIFFFSFFNITKFY